MSKKCKLMYIIFMILFFSSCDDEYGCSGDPDSPPVYSYCLINDTKYKVDIKLFNWDNSFLYEKLQIDTFFIHEQEQNDTIPHPFRSNRENGDIFVKLIYDDTVGILFENPRSPNKYDIRNKYNYKKVCFGMYNEHEYYVKHITEADYQYALEHREGNE